MASYSFLIYFLAVSVSFGATTGGDIQTSDKDNLGIIGGHEISIKKAPYMAAVYGSNDFINYHPICGGSIIHKRFILTAASCIMMRNNASHKFNSYLVLVGTNRLNISTGIKIYVEKPICHTQFNGISFKNNICLLKLQYPITFWANVNEVTLPGKNFKLKSGKYVNVSGWGITKNTNRPTYSLVKSLHQVTVKALSKKECKMYYNFNDATMICAGKPPSSGFCVWTANNVELLHGIPANKRHFDEVEMNKDHAFLKALGIYFDVKCDQFKGDNGGPLIYNNLQVGIASFARSYAGNTQCGLYPNGYTKVASYIGWINSTIKYNL